MSGKKRYEKPMVLVEEYEMTEFAKSCGDIAGWFWADYECKWSNEGLPEGLPIPDGRKCRYTSAGQGDGRNVNIIAYSSASPSDASREGGIMLMNYWWKTDENGNPVVGDPCIVEAETDWQDEGVNFTSR